MSAEDARKRWELENEIEVDAVFEYPTNRDENDKPWLQDKKCFTEVKMSAVALLNIMTHAASSSEQVFGILKGYYTGNTIVVLEAIPFSDQGFDEKMAEALDLRRVLGPYKSYPGFGLWPGMTDRIHFSRLPEPHLAVIVDPVRTQKAGKVDIAAFRSLKETECYSLNISFFKSALDSKLLDTYWDKYWGERLGESQYIINNRFIHRKLEEIADLTELAEEQLEKNIKLGSNQNSNVNSSWKATTISTEASMEQISGVYDEVFKLMMFSGNIYNNTK